MEEEAAAAGGGRRVEKEESRSRKGPWTEQEDMQLVCYVGLFGQRRWDFLAKVSGLRGGGDYTKLCHCLLYLTILNAI